MIQKIVAPISVITSYNHTTRKTIPVRLKWEGREYSIEKVGFHHYFRKGRTMVHVFSVVTGSNFFRLELDTENLQWEVTEIADDLAN